MVGSRAELVIVIEHQLRLRSWSARSEEQLDNL